MNIAFIPARGGSKGIVKKNIQPINGVPLIFYTLNAIENSKIFDLTVVDTDSEEIAEAVSTYKKVVIHYRDPDLGADHVHAYHVLKDWCVKHQIQYGADSNIVLLLPTCALRSAKSIADSFKTYTEGATEHPVVSVYFSKKKEQHLRLIGNDGTLVTCGDLKIGNLQRNFGRPIYFLNGGIYWWKIMHVVAGDSFHIPGARPYEMPFAESIDIDDLADIELVESLLKSRNE